MKKTRQKNSIGDSQCIYETAKGRISLIYPCENTRGYYEIYGQTDNLLDEPERYESEAEAEKRINELLN
jgi:hypothetical protein